MDGGTFTDASGADRQRVERRRVPASAVEQLYVGERTAQHAERGGQKGVTLGLRPQRLQGFGKPVGQKAVYVGQIGARPGLGAGRWIAADCGGDSGFLFRTRSFRPNVLRPGIERLRHVN